MQAAKWVTKLSPGCPQTLKNINCDHPIEIDIELICKCNNCQNDSKYLCEYKKHREMEFEITTTMFNGTFLKNDLKKLLFNKELSDFVFKFGNDEIPVNKAILSVRSPVFYKFFNSNFKEKTMTSYSAITDTSADAFKELIRFIYIEKIENLHTHVFELLQASDYYDIKSLKERCEAKLYKMLNNDNANLIFQNSHTYGCSKKLKRAAFNQIKKIFMKRNFDLNDNLMNDPKKVDELLSALGILEENLEGQSALQPLK